MAWLLLTALVILGCQSDEPAPMTTEEVKWGYDGPGAPENWAALSEEYATCAQGKQQSPIDISVHQEVIAEPIVFSYGNNAKAVRNEGYFVYADYAPGNRLSVGQRTLDLQSAHLHSPSEHRIDGASFEAEMHLIHADDGDRLVVVALLFELGAPSPIVQAVLDAAPAAGNTIRDVTTLNASGYVPERPGYFRYSGSLTTPPCHESIDWYVIREPKTVSQEQVERLLALSGGPNNRPVQPVGNRAIVIGGER